MTRAAPWCVIVVGAFALVFACNDATPNLLYRAYDAGADAGADDAPEASPAEAGVDGAFLGGPCEDDTQCNDGIACTFDLCDLTVDRCRNVPDDTQCDDGVYCDGHETCEPGHGCVAGAPVTCDDGDPCTVDRCVEATMSCAHAPRDLDDDGDPDDHCEAHHDCNDLDPTVSSLHAEVCANGKDDNCNGVIDETPCVTATGDVCATAIAVTPGGTVTLSTVGDNKDYTTSCDLGDAGERDIVAAVAVPAGANADLDVWVSSQGAPVSVAIESTCGDDTTELACGAGGGDQTRARARNLAPGTYDVIVTTAGETTFDLETNLLTPTPKATNVDCATATPVATDTPFVVSLINPPTDLASACADETGALTYSFTLAAPADVRVFASTAMGSGAPVVGLRDAHCTDPADELFCNQSTSLPLYARALAAGTYYLTVAGTSPIDVNVQITTSAPTATPPDQTCAAPPTATLNATMAVDLSSHEAAVVDGCLPGGPTAAYDLSLAAASDVLVVARFPQTDSGAVSLDTPACDQATRVACSAGETPVHVGKRGVSAGDYRVVLTDQLGAAASLTTLVRDAVAPTIVSGADTCGAAVAIPPAGGFFTGDTSTASANYENACDGPGYLTGAPDQVLSLTLGAPQRVILDMEGSTYTTLLDVYEAPGCPGTPVMNACYVGFAGERSFLDLELTAGQYWIVVDGYQGASGPWSLDVRVIAP